MVWWRAGFGMWVFCCGLVSCQCESFWGKPEGSCDPAQNAAIAGAPRWRETFGAAGAPGCLRLSWGAKDSEARALYVRLTQTGQMRAFDAQTRGFDGSLVFSLPPDSRGKPIAFVYFAFGAGAKVRSTSDQAAHCASVMAQASYRCLPDEGGECWFSMAFQPSSNTGAQAVVVPQACELQAPPQVSRPGGVGDGGKDRAEPLESQAEPRREPVVERDASPEPPIEGPREPPPQETHEARPELRPEPIPDGAAQASWARAAGAEVLDVATDSRGNIYITGSFLGTGTFDSTSFSSRGKRDAFVAKLDPTGAFLWARQIGSGGVDKGLAVAVSAAGKVYATGYFELKANVGGVELVSNGGQDIFVVAYDPGGTVLWKLQVGGVGDDQGHGLAIDGNGNIALVGAFVGKVNFGSALLDSSNSKSDIFVASLDPQGNWLWASSLGSSGKDIAFDVAVTAKGDAFVVGEFQSSLSCNGMTLKAKSFDAFAARFDGRGKCSWISRAGGPLSDKARSVALDSSGLYLVGEFSATLPDTADFGAVKLSAASADAIFVAKLDLNGKFLWATKGDSSDPSAQHEAFGVAVDGKGRVFVTGVFQEKILYLGGGITFTGSGKEVFLAAFNGLQGQFLFAHGAGGSGDQFGSGVAIHLGSPLVVGSFSSQAHFAGRTLKGGASVGFLWRSK